MPQLIAQYLAHEGYVDTAKVFVDEVQAAKTLVCPDDAPIQSFEFKEDLDAINRQCECSVALCCESKLRTYC